MPRLSLTTGGGGGRANQWPMAVARGAPGGDDGDHDGDCGGDHVDRDHNKVNDDLGDW